MEITWDDVISFAIVSCFLTPIGAVVYVLIMKSLRESKTCSVVPYETVRRSE